MIARSRAVIAAGGKLAELACQPPLTLRQVAGGEAGTCALCLVGTAAGPLAGDDLELELVVGPGPLARTSRRAGPGARPSGRPDRMPSGRRNGRRRGGTAGPR